MKKLFLILIPVLLLVIPNKCEAKYILEKTTKVSVNIQSPVSLTITDINNSIINNNEIAVEFAQVSFNSGGATYKYNDAGYDFDNSTEIKLDNNQQICEEGFYQIILNNSKYYNFQIKKAVCKNSDNHYYLTLQEAVNIPNNKIELLNNFSENTITVNENVSLDLKFYTVSTSFIIPSNVVFDITNGVVKGLENIPTFKVFGTLNTIIGFYYQTGTAPIIECNGGEVNTKDGSFEGTTNACINSISSNINILGGTFRSSCESPVLKANSSIINIENAIIKHLLQGYYKAIDITSSKLKIDKNTKITSKNLSIIAASSDILIISANIRGGITSLGGNSILEVRKNVQIQSSSAVATITSYNHLIVDGAKIINNKDERAIHIAGGRADITNANLTSNWLYTVYAVYENTTVNISNSTIINTANNYAIFAREGGVTIDENTVITGNVQY